MKELWSAVGEDALPAQRHETEMNAASWCDKTVAS